MTGWRCLVLEVCLETGDDRLPPRLFLGDGCGVVELLFDIEDGKKSVFEISPGHGRSEQERGVVGQAEAGLFWIVAEGSPYHGGVDFRLLIFAQ